MLEIITGTALAAPAGLNAYIPLLGLGLLARFTTLVDLPDSWAWLTNPWALGVVGVLLLLEIIVDKVPALDSVNDVIQTIVRPAAGGLVFSAGSASETLAVTDPAAFVNSAQFWPFVIGAAVAFVPHLLKSLARPMINLVSAGAGATVSSTIEDIGAAVLVVLAVVVPVLALLLVLGALVWLVRRLVRLAASRKL